VLIAAALGLAACAPPDVAERRPPAEGVPEAGSPELAAPGTAGSHRAPTTFAATADRELAGCTLFTRNHFLNARHVDLLPVHPRSSTYIAFLGGGQANLHTPSSTIWEGSRTGMPINVVDSRLTGMEEIELDHSYTSRSHFGAYPVPENPRIQGYPGQAWDRHLVMVDVADCTAYELIQFDPDAPGLTGRRTALAGTRYPLSSPEMPRMTTNVANTPLVGQYVMVDEVNAGSVPHPIGACTSNGGSEATWPARMSDGPHDTPDAPPMGSWLRLRADVDLDRFSGQARPVAEAMRHHGIILTDTCPHPLSIMGENSDGWVKEEIRQLRELTAADFEVVDTTPMRVSEDSFLVR